MIVIRKYARNVRIMSIVMCDAKMYDEREDIVWEVQDIFLRWEN